MRALWFILATLVAAALGMVGTVFVGSMGLVVPMYAVWPVALGAAAGLAAVAASWVGNLLASGRTRLPAVLAATGIAALVLSVLLAAPIVVPALEMALLGGPLIYTAGGCVAAISVVAGIASLRLRWDGAVALLLSAAVRSL